MTKSEFNSKVDSFFAKWDNKFVDFDGVYGNQCVDEIKQYFKEVVGIEPKARGDAVKYWDNTPEMDRIANTPTGVPEKGDVIIWNAKVGAGSGHISIAKGVGNTSSFDSFDQNWPVGSPCHFVNHNYTNVIGWLRMRNINDPVTPDPPKPNIDPKDVKIDSLNAQVTSLSAQITDLTKQYNLRGDAIVQLEIDIEKITKELKIAKADVEHRDDLIQIQEDEIGSLKKKIKTSEDNPVVTQVTEDCFKELFDKIKLLIRKVKDGIHKKNPLK